MLATMALLRECGLLAKLARIPARDASPERRPALVHDPAYVAAVRRAAEDGGGWVDPDTLITPRSYDVAMRVVGGTLAALDAVMRRDVNVGVLPGAARRGTTPLRTRRWASACSTTLPSPRRTRGARTALSSAWRSSTTTCTTATARRTRSTTIGVLYISTHSTRSTRVRVRRAGSVPGRARVQRQHPDAARRRRRVYRRAFEDVAMPALHRYRPQLVLVSAGYDAHFADGSPGSSSASTASAHSWRW